MGEHGTFTTEHTCGKCIDALFTACDRDPDIAALRERHNSLSGLIRGTYAGEEAHRMEWALEAAELCHPLRVVVMTEGTGVVLLYSGAEKEALVGSFNIKVRCLK